MSKREKIAYRVVLCLIVLAGLTALLIQARLGRDNSLLARATRVASTATWCNQYPMVATDFNYEWLSDHEILFLAQNGAGNGLYKRLDTHTGVITAFSTPRSLPRKPVPIPTISPDGKWFAWLQPSGPHYIYIVSSTDGRVVRTWPPRWCADPIWFADSRRFGDLFWENNALTLTVHSLDTPRMQKIKLPEMDLLYPIHCTPEGNLLLLMHDGVASQTGPMHIVEIAPDTGTILHRYTVPKPSSCFPLPDISPQGDRLLWMQDTQSPPPAYAWLHRFFSSISDQGKPIIKIRTSRLDGSDLQEIGDVPTDGTPYPAFSGIHWMPDGKHLSFTYNGSLWTVPSGKPKE